MDVARIALIATTMSGMALCGSGVGRVAAHHDWLNPLALLSIALGALALWVVAGALLNARLLFITSDAAAIAAVAAIVILKVALTRLHALT
jgi:hypothetical protein